MDSRQADQEKNINLFSEQIKAEKEIYEQRRQADKEELKNGLLENEVIMV